MAVVLVVEGRFEVVVLAVEVAVVSNVAVLGIVVLTVVVDVDFNSDERAGTVAYPVMLLPDLSIRFSKKSLKNPAEAIGATNNIMPNKISPLFINIKKHTDVYKFFAKEK